uniref:GK20341 n=2 Tax=Drosophila willistoni TaxID=7260 RepID=B4N5D2_DROWI
MLLNDNDVQYESKLKALHQKSADRLLETCLLNGGLYIKVGQGFAAINHILPVEYTRTLSKLQDSCLPTPSSDVQKVFQKDFGLLPEEIYVDFDYKPVAAASLAQVFKAKLPNGEQVAVKVQYNDLQKRFISDLGTIIFLQDIVEFFFKDYNFGWILNDLRKNLVQELNFIQEGKNAERCAKDLKKFDFVRVPQVHWSHTKTRVLTLEWMDGCKISDIKSIKAQNLSLHDIDVKLFQTFSEQIFYSGFVHADPHPGNIFVRPNAKGRADIILLDHGLYEELPAEVRGPLCEFWEATVLRNEAKMKTAAQKIGIADYMRFAEVLFQQPIRIRGGRIRSKLNQEDIEYMQMVAKKNFELIMGTLKEMPRSMLFVVRNLNTVRAISHQHGDVVDRPRIMARYAQRCLYNKQSPIQYVRWLCHRIYFEYCMWLTTFKMQLINWYFNVLYLLGRAPASAKTIMQDLLNPDHLNH